MAFLFPPRRNTNLFHVITTLAHDSADKALRNVTVSCRTRKKRNPTPPKKKLKWKSKKIKSRVLLEDEKSHSCQMRPFQKISRWWDLEIQWVWDFLKKKNSCMPLINYSAILLKERKAGARADMSSVVFRTCPGIYFHYSRVIPCVSLQPLTLFLLCLFQRKHI